MKNLVAFLVSQIVDQPNTVMIDEATNDYGDLTLTLKVAESDMGRVIGKQGKIIQAIRQLVKVKAIKEGKHVRLEISEPGNISITNPAGE
jgi:hypothetical protein